MQTHDNRYLFRMPLLAFCMLAAMLLLCVCLLRRAAPNGAVAIRSCLADDESLENAINAFCEKSAQSELREAVQVFYGRLDD